MTPTLPAEVLDAVNDWPRFGESYADGIKRIALLAYRAGLREQEGMVSVPREPTEAMLFAGADCEGMKQINDWISEMQLVRGRKPTWSTDDPPLAQAYRAMLAAHEKEKG